MNENNDFNLMGKIIDFAKKNPIVALLIGTGIISIFAIILVTFITVTYPTVAVSNFFASTWDKVTDFFTPDEEDTEPDMTTKEGRKEKCLIDFNIQDENSEEGKTTIEYCEELYKVTMEYKEDYGVTINPMLITATLFYGRTYADYTNEGYTGEACDAEGNGEKCETATNTLTAENFSSWFNDPEYNKKAKKYIKTLAGFMLLRTESTYSCGDTASSSITPTSYPELAKSEYNSMSGAAVQKATYVTPYNGDKDEPGSCPYEDDGAKYIKKYQNSHSYSTLQKSYTSVQNYCKNDTDSYDCKRATDVYDHNKNFLFTQWGEKGIVNDPPGSNTINFTCPYVRSAPVYKKNEYFFNGCSEAPYKTIRYTVNYNREGLYYYRLMAPMVNYILFFPVETEDSFISKYYDYLVKTDDGEISEENQLRIVEKIYELYETIMGNLPLDFSEIGLYVNTPPFPGVVAGDWVTWSQKHEPWQSFLLGSTPDTSIYEIGCAMTSLSKIIAMSGASSTFINGDFNPGSFAAAMKANGGFSSGGMIYWDVASKVAPGIQYINRIECPAGDCYSQVLSLANEGYLLVIKVIKNEHWVAFTGIENGEIMISDTVAREGVPETIKPLSQTTYSGIYGIRVYELRM